MTRIINQNGRDVAEEVYAEFRKVVKADLTKASQTYTLASGLVAYDLEAPAKNLYPVLTPMRNRIPRATRGAGAGDAAHWKVVTGIEGGGVSSMGWVPEGQRAAKMTISTADKSATYVTIGEEADVSFEAQSAAEGFEDVMSSAGMRLLQSIMIKEEYGILGGNRSVALGTPTAPTVTVVTTGGSIADATYNVKVVALTLEGYLAITTLAAGVKQQVTITGQDSQTYTLNGGSSALSAATSTGAISATNANIIKAYTPAIKGALAYAWYVGVGADANLKLEAVTTINSVELTALAGTGQAASAVTADRSRNTSLAYDGLLYSAFGDSSAYYKSMATGTEGTGTALTASGNGSITEIDDMLLTFWNTRRLSPEEIYVNAEQLLDIRNKVMSGSGTPLARFLFDVDQKNPNLVAGSTVGWYFNPFSMDGGQLIPIKLHPHLPPGTLFTWAQNLPAQYAAAGVPNTAAVQCRRDYYQIPWPLLTRANQTGVYCESVLKVLAPFALGVISNIGG